MNTDRPALLAAYCDDGLSVEAAEQPVRMLEDDSTPAQAGEDLSCPAEAT